MRKSESAAFSTLGGQGRTAMSRLVSDMAPLRTIYDVAFRNVLVEHELGIENDFIEIMEFVLDSTLYNIRNSPREQ